MNNNNGFADSLKQMKTLMQVNEKVTLSILEEAAEYFASRLKTRIPVSDRNTKHLRDQLRVKIVGDKVQVFFEDVGWYWHLVEHGHKKRGRRGRVKGSHFVRNTWDAENVKVEEIMLTKIIKKMEG